MHSFAIIGKGNIGSAMSSVLKRAKVHHASWDIKADTKDRLSHLLQTSDVILLCIPSWANRNLCKDIMAQRSRKKKLVMTLSKGIEEATLKTMDEIFRDELYAPMDYGIMAGPMLAKEIELGLPAKTAFAVSHARWRKPLENIFASTNLILSFSPDMHGIALCSVLKNVYTVGLGIVDALSYGSNAKSALAVDIFSEMKAILLLLGGKADTIYGLAGLGDLLTTGWSGLSYNYRIGRGIVLENNSCPVSEGCVSITSVAKLLGKKLPRFSFLSALENIIVQQHDPKKTIEAFFRSSRVRA